VCFRLKMKPPKSWLEEYASNNGNDPKAKSKSIGGNMDNSHRHYMARKIDLQRNQFGSLLPPDPRNYREDDTEDQQEHDENLSAPSNRKHISADHGCENGIAQSQDMTSVLSRLKMKHKRSGSKQKLSSRKKKKQRIKDSDEEDGDEVKHQLRSSFMTPPIWQGVTTPSYLNPQDCESLNTPTPMKSVLQLKRERKDLFFLGITVLVNGYTNPSSDAIMRIMHKHGGDLEKYETSRVTHIIAESLSTAKAKIYKKQKRPVPVVKPQWVVDCVTARKFLPHADYILEEVRAESVGASVKMFFKGSLSATGNVKCASEKESASVLKDKYAPRRESQHNRAATANSPLRERGVQSQMGASPFSVTFASPPHTPLPREHCIEQITVYQQEDDNDSSSTSVSGVQSPRKCQLFGSQSPQSPLKPIMMQKFDESTRNLQSRIKGTSNISEDADSIQRTPEKLSRMKQVRIAKSPTISTEKRPSTVEMLPLSNNNVFNSPRTMHRSIGGAKTVGTDPNFLEAYFNNSRLSFIGSFKQRLGKSNQCTSAIAKNKGTKRFVFHVDMDCFFAAIAIRNHPQYIDTPVAVGHAWRSDPNGVGVDPAPLRKSEDTKKSKCELSTCNYIARKFGVKKGMFLDRARQLCPELVVLPYYYDDYEDASRKVGDILQFYVDEYQGAIEQVSCDEAYLEFNFGDDEQNTEDQPDNSTKEVQVNELARLIGDKIRKDILGATKCSASVGIGPNKLLAKLATNKAKNLGGDGLAIAGYWKIFLKEVKLKEIPGIGYKMDRKLQAHNLTFVRDVWDMSDGELSNILGAGTGAKVFKYCHGEDDRPVKPAERKTIGAECNYGVRFDGPYGVDYMMTGLAEEVEKRMANVGVFGRHLTVKVKERQDGAGAPGKFNGHGKCNDHSKSCNLPGHYATRDSAVITSEAMKLYSEMGIDKDEIRGIGIVISKLDSEDGQHCSNAGISTWFKTGINQVEHSKNADIRKHKYQSAVKDGGFECGSTIDSKCSKIKRVDECSEKKVSPFYPQHANVGEFCPPTSSKMNEKGKNIPAISNAKHRSRRVVTSDGKYRQFDVKCMLKLALIKSGENKLSYDGVQVSLTQLDSLPLEIQLQVANNDDITVRVLPRKSCSSKERNIRTEEVEIVELDEDSDETSSNQYANSSKIIDVVCETDEGDDLLFLRDWMDGQESHTIEDVGKMKDFLCICVLEKRLDDVVTYLRLIRGRQDEWKERYQELFAAVQMTIFREQGRTLDRDGLGL
jgi:nucleotidyltransferase/DNA polymerase involved in DNA repair